MIDEERTTRLHEAAMAYAQEAMIANHPGEALRLYRLAFENEREAASLLDREMDEEPTRSILFRSAATLALDCKDFDEAERLAARGLGGFPPADIAAELRDVWDRIHFERHLDVQGIALEEGDLELVMVGPGIGRGLASAQTFFPRYRATQGLFFRTAERLAGLPFAERPRRETVDRFSFFFAPPHESSFAVTVRVGRNLALPGADYSEKVIGEIVDCMQLYEAGRDQELDRRIPEEYRKNFEALASQLAPDGVAVTLVGFSTRHAGEHRKVSITRTSPLKDLAEDVGVLELSESLGRGRITVRGMLLFASSVGHRKTRTIKIETAEGKIYKVSVDAAIMHDIVRPFYEEQVIAELALQRHGGYKLINIAGA